MTKPNQTTFPIVSDHDIAIDFEGLTKREYFAGHAMQGLISAQAPFSDIGSDTMLGGKFVAEQSLIYADALIAQLNTPA